MGRERAAGAASAAATRSAAAQKHKRRTRYGDNEVVSRPTLVARRAQPKLKYQSYFEFQENKDKKKKLEIQVTNDKTPQGGFTFVPIGNPELTNVCKELSREEDALIFIVSGTKEKNHNLVEHVHRIGYHFRSYIVDQAAQQLGGLQGVQDGSSAVIANKTDAIPETQEEINKQADAAIRDLYPRIPNTDREMIIQHAFQKGALFHGKPVVGLQEDLSLSRRVQLAVIAHIRHNHTRYDQLLRETDWAKARKTVEGLCLDILLKWRGDEETGRDQLDEVLREIVVISDSDEENGEDEGDDASDDDVEFISINRVTPGTQPDPVALGRSDPMPHTASRRISGNARPKMRGKGRKRAKKQTRYNLRSQKALEDARNRIKNQRPEDDISMRQILDVPHPAVMEPEIREPQTRSHDGQVERRYIMDERPQLERPVQYYPSQFVRDDYDPYGEQVIVRTRPETVPDYGHGYAPESAGYRDRRILSPLPREALISQTSMRQPYSSGPREYQDVVLPSIEQPVELPSEPSYSNHANRLTQPNEGHYRQQVMYTEQGDSSYAEVLPNRPNVIYVDDPDMPSKRRRILVDPDFAGSHDQGGSEYVRLVPRQRPESHYVPVSTLPIRNEVDARDRIDVQSQRLVIGRDSFLSQDPFPTQVRVVRRGPDNETSVKVLPVYDEGDEPYRLRDRDEVFYETTRRIPPPRVLQENERPVDRSQQGRPVTLERPLMDYQPRLAGDFLDSSASFSSTPRSHEVSHYASAISRIQREENSRLSSARPTYRDADPHTYPLRSTHFAPYRMEEDPYRREEGYRIMEVRDGIRMEPRERSMVPSSGVREFGEPSNTVDMRAPPRYVRSFRNGEEIITLE